jgi:hypothetical protein
MNISISSEGSMYNAFIDVHQISNIYLMCISLRNFLMQELQKNIQQRPIQKLPVIVQPRLQPKPQSRPQYRYEDDDYEEQPDIGPNPFDADHDWRNPEDDIDLILGYNNKRTNRIARKIAKKLRDAKDRHKDRELTRAMRNLTLDGNEMDVDTAPDDDGGFRIVSVWTSKKK